jgi:hypothetical protein
LEEKEMKPSCSISVSVLDQATQCSSVVVKKKWKNREDKKDEKRKDFFSEETGPKKSPQAWGYRRKGVVLAPGTPRHARKQKTKISFVESGWVDQAELSILLCDCWLGNVVKRSRQYRERLASSFGHEIGIKTSLCFW